MKIDMRNSHDDSDHDACLVPKYFDKKELVMRFVALVAFIAIAPLLLLLILGIKLTSRGPGLYRQARVGKDGKIFDVVKIRTMYENAEKHTGPVWCSQKDPRITPLGNFYRFLHLDELPQLINVVKGEMCLVGPRPERPEIIARDQLNIKIPHYSERSQILPGITGLAQINLPPDETIECVRRKVRLDLRYISDASPWLDFRILTCTALRMCGLRHGLAAKLLRVCYKVEEIPSLSQVPIDLPDHFNDRLTSKKPPKRVVTLTGVGANGSSAADFVPKRASIPAVISTYDDNAARLEEPVTAVKPR